MAIELNEFVEKVLRDLAGFVPVGEEIRFEVSPSYFSYIGLDLSHAIIANSTNPHEDKIIFAVPQRYE